MPNPVTDFKTRLADTARLIEAELAERLSGDRLAGAPDRLVEAMRHAVLGGGKRLRPFLVVESATLFGLPPRDALPAALAVELIHGYSLVHDDLPAMDNDRLRRGRPTVWAAYDDWTAILAGDALQALAFDVIAGGDAAASRPAVAASLCQALAEASGARGMVGGQAIDLAADKLGEPVSPGADHIRRLQAMKTGALIRFSCEAGAILAEAAKEERAALAEYGRCLGYAFQIADDLLDVEGDAATVGKAVAKDAGANKATLVSLMGVETARAELRATVAAAKAALTPFGKSGTILHQAADFVAERDA